MEQAVPLLLVRVMCFLLRVILLVRVMSCFAENVLRRDKGRSTMTERQVLAKSAPICPARGQES